MAVVKRSISIDPEIWQAVQRAVGPSPGRVSAFVNEALAHHVRVTLGLQAVAAWEEEHGRLSAEELAAADELLDEAGVGPVASAASG
jgi:hypothetical protein